MAENLRQAENKAQFSVEDHDIDVCASDVLPGESICFVDLMGSKIIIPVGRFQISKSFQVTKNIKNDNFIENQSR